MTAYKQDYEALEIEFIQGEMTIRELCRQHDIRSWSSVATQSRKREWKRKREDYRRRKTNKTIDKLADVEAERALADREQVALVLQGILARFAERLASEDESKRPIIAPREAILAAEKLLILRGEPTSRTENLNLGLNFSAELPPDVAVALAELARQRRGTEPRRLGSGLPPLAQGIGEG
jgi:hypothetical protein